MAYTIKNHQKVLDKAKTHTVAHYHGPWYDVLSGASGNYYLVNLDELRCSCPRQPYISYHMNEGVNGCSHVLAVFLFVYGDEGYSLVARPDGDYAHLKRHTVTRLNGDNVVITARLLARENEARQAKPGKPRKVFTAAEVNDQLFG